MSLPPHEIHLWLCARPLAAHPALATLITPAEQQQAANIASLSRRTEWLAGRTLLRQCLAHYTGRNALDLAFVTTAQGKPQLIDAPIFEAFDFNISHGQHWIGCALARAVSVGLDIDSTRRKTRINAIAARYFHASEQQIMANQVSEYSQQQCFFKLWTLKEAYIKACGNKLTGRRLHDIVFTLTNDGTSAQPLFPLPDGHWHFSQRSFLSDQHLALASQWLENRPVQIRYWLWRPDASLIELQADISRSFIDKFTGELCAFPLD